MRSIAFQLCSLSLSLNLTESAFADNAVQGKVVKPKFDPTASEEIVRMVLSDNERTPIVDISPEGPTELVFPGESNVVKCTNTSTYVREAKEEKATIQSRGGKWFTDIVFYVDDNVLSDTNVMESLKRRPAVICHYEHGGKIYRRQVKFRFNEKKRNAVVFFEREEDREFDEFMSRGMLAPRIITVKRGEEPKVNEQKPEEEAIASGSKPKVITVHREKAQPEMDKPEPPAKAEDGPVSPRIITIKR